LLERKKKKALTCPSEDNGTGASAEGVIGGAFSLTFLTALLGGGGIIIASSEDTGTTSFVDAVLSELILAFFEGGGSLSPLELIKRH
jgi:hypothetical protein